MRNKSAALCLALCLGLTATLPGVAQNKINPVIEVERLYDAQLMDVTKPKLDSSVPDSLRAYHTLMQYTIFDKPLSNLYAFVPLAPAVIEPAAPLRQRYGTFQVGSGFPWTPQADLYLQTPFSGKWTATLDAQHRSFWGTLDTPWENQASHDRMRNNGALSLERRSSRNTFYIKAQANQLFHTYTAVPAWIEEDPAMDRSYNHAELSQSFYRAGAHIGFYSLGNKTQTWRYAVDAGYTHAQNNQYDLGTGRISAENKLSMEGLAGYNLKEDLSVNLSAFWKTASNVWMEGGTWTAHGVGGVFPHVTWNGPRFALTAGAKVHYVYRTYQDALMVYPHLTAHYSFAPEISVYGKLTGDSQLNTMQDRLLENPWLTAPVDSIGMRDQRTPWDAEVGLSGTFHDVFSYRIYGGYRYTRGQAQYRPTVGMVSGDDASMLYPYNALLYTLEYVRESRYTAGAQASYNSKFFQAQVQAAWYQYTICTGYPAWFKPSFELNAYMRYNWRERIVVQADAYYRGACESVKAESPYGTNEALAFATTTLPAFVDVNLKATYCWTPLFSTFLYANNLLNAERAYYYGYTLPGITAGVGLALNF